MKKLKILSFCCLFFGSLNAQGYDKEKFLNQFKSFASMTPNGQDSLFYYRKLSFKGNCKIFESTYLNNNTPFVLKGDFHTFFKEKLSSADLIILDEFWNEECEEFSAKVIEQSRICRK